MPIESVNRGKNVFREVHFGSGDIVIMKARQSDQHTYDDLIILAQDGRINEIGGDAGYGGTTTDEIPMTVEPVSLLFDRSASVRVLIDDLLEIEQNLIADGK